MKNSSPKVTVAVPLHNHERYVEECIESVISQDWPSVELIVVNDGSTDRSGEAVKRLLQKSGSGFKYVEKKNEGLVPTLNLALGMAGGEYFCELASDDVLMPGSIRKRAERLAAEPELDAVFSDGYLIEGTHKTEKRLIAGGRKQGFTSRRHGLEDFLEGRAVFLLPIGMMKTSSIRGIGGFDPDFYIEDVYTRFVIARDWKVDFIDEPIFYRRDHETNISKGKPFWMRREKKLAFEKLLSSERTTGRDRAVAERFLYKEYLKFLRAGVMGADNASGEPGSRKGPPSKEELIEAARKAVALKPFSIRARYYGMLVGA